MTQTTNMIGINGQVIKQEDESDPYNISSNKYKKQQEQPAAAPNPGKPQKRPEAFEEEAYEDQDQFFDEEDLDLDQDRMDEEQLEPEDHQPTRGRPPATAAPSQKENQAHFRPQQLQQPMNRRAGQTASNEDYRRGDSRSRRRAFRPAESEPAAELPRLDEPRESAGEETDADKPSDEARKGLSALNAGLKVSSSNVELAASLNRHSQSTQPKRSASNERMKEEDVNILYEQHEKLLDTLMVEEDTIIESHKGLIDSMINSIKEDSELFSNLQSQGRAA